jgi:hypothetical protein
MKPRVNVLLTVLFLLLAYGSASAQPFFYGGAFFGFKSSGLKGVFKLTTQAGTGTGNVVDGGATSFTFGLSGGYQVFPKGFAGGWYKLDLNLDLSYSWYPYLENAYNAQVGSGSFAARGLSGGTTKIISIDIMPLHRVEFSKFKLLSPYLGVGLGMNIMSTGDVTVSPPSGNGTLTGVGDFKLGLLIFYGTLFRFVDFMEPYLQFKHMIPFGSETQFTEEYQATGGQGGGSTKYAMSIQDVPGFFSITAGVRIKF